MTREPITIADLHVAPGTRAYGHLNAGQLAARTPVNIPLQVIHGAHEGPTLCLESTLHGWEPMGAEVIRRAMQLVDPAQLRGTIYCLPLANPFSVEFGGSVESAGTRINPADMLDMNRVWPGKLENAWLTEQMAAVMWEHVLSKCQYLVDYHDGTGACDELPVAFPHALPANAREGLSAGQADGVGGGASTMVDLTPEYIADMNAKIRGMAIAWGSPVVWWRQGPVNPAMISGQCLVRGIVPLVVEVGGGGIVDATIDQGVTCTLNILRHLNMIAGAVERPANQIMVDRYVVLRSRCGGFYQPEPEIVLSATVTRGQLLGRVVDPLTSEVLEECRSPVNGFVVSRRIRLPLNPGGYVAHIADTDAVIWRGEQA